MPRSRHAAKPTNRAPGSSRFWHGIRQIILGLLIALSGAAFAGYVVVRWAEHQVLSVDGWVHYASSLPQDPDVSWALADKLVAQVFEGVAIEQKIAEALPPRAGFLASPLSDQLQERSVRVTQRMVQSDTFVSLWTGANRLAMERFLTNARTGQAAERIAGREQFAVDLANARPLLRDRLAGQAAPSPILQEGGRQPIGITAGLRTRRERLWQFVQTMDFLYAVLPALFAASLLSALVLARSGRRLVLAVALTTLALLLVLLIVIRYFRGELLDGVQNSAHKPAVTHVYDSLTDSLRQAVWYGLGMWTIVLVLVWAAGPSRWAVALRQFLRVPYIRTSRPAGWWQRARLHAAQYRYALWGGIAGLVLLYLGLLASVTVVSIVNSVLIGLCGVLLIQLFARSESAPPQSPGKKLKNE
jgi:hypothetical protein